MVLGPQGPGRVGRRRFFGSRAAPRGGPSALPAIYTLQPVSTLAIVLIVVGVVILLLLAGGLLGARRRDRRRAPTYAEHLRQADHALEQARAADRGWDREVMERIVRDTLAHEHPGTVFDRIELVLVDDQPGVAEDRAHFEGVDGDRRVQVVIARSDSGWAPERVS